MADVVPTPAHFRFTCPHCHGVIKVKTDWSGRRGICPHCSEKVRFPHFQKPSGQSATTVQLLKLVAPDDRAGMNEATLDRLALLLSQATCRDYQLARELLKAGTEDESLSPRQWRRALNAADMRESMRLKIDQRIAAGAADNPADDADPAALLAAAEAANAGTPNAWKIMARYLYFARHGTCDACRANPTGLQCIYLTFEKFLEARTIPAERADHWREKLHQHVGL